MAVGINPYLAAMAVSVLVTACFVAVGKSYMSVRNGLSVLAMIGICFVVTASAFGLIGSENKDFTAEGYRYFSMNLLAPIDPSPAGGSSVMPPQRTFTNGQYEGYNYLGAGTLALLILAVFVTLTGRIKLTRDDLVKWAPVTVCGVVFAVLALSTLVSMGDRAVFDWDPSQRLTPYLAALRASGRLFWLPYYLITTYAVVSSIRFLKPRDGIVILSALLALQIYDTRPVRQQVRAARSGSAPGNLISPVWRTLNRDHRNLMVLPAWQCKGENSPGDGDGFRIFGLLAAEQGLGINSYYAARYHQNTLTFHCKTAIEQVSKEGLAAHTAYVVSPQVARMIANGPTGADHCYGVDGFILCTMSEIAGVGHWPEPAPEVPLSARDLRHGRRLFCFRLGHADSWIWNMESEHKGCPRLSHSAHLRQISPPRADDGHWQEPCNLQCDSRKRTDRRRDSSCESVRDLCFYCATADRRRSYSARSDDLDSTTPVANGTGFQYRFKKNGNRRSFSRGRRLPTILSNRFSPGG